MEACAHPSGEADGVALMSVRRIPIPLSGKNDGFIDGESSPADDKSYFQLN